MFEATLQAADPDRQRLHRLTLAAAITVASTATAFASVWTLDRLQIDRLGGPSQKFEIAHLSLLPPPKPVEPPPPPGDVVDESESSEVTNSPAKPNLVESPSEVSERTSRPTSGSSGRGIPAGPGISGPGGSGPGIPGLGGDRGPIRYDKIGDDFGQKDDPAPTEVDFSALRCLYCADPDRAELRKTPAAKQRRNGTVALRFCVDRAGRVEARSIKVSRSHGDAAVDRIVTAALTRWRFSPMKVGNEPRRACSSTVFNIHFD